MLTTQRIAKDIKFLRHISNNRPDGFNLFDLRMRVIHSTKLFVDPTIVTDSHESITGLLDRLFNFPNISIEQFQQRVENLKQFAKLPFKSMTLDYDKGCVLLETTEDDMIQGIIVIEDGKVMPYRVSIASISSGRHDDGRPQIRCVVNMHCTDSTEKWAKETWTAYDVRDISLGKASITRRVEPGYQQAHEHERVMTQFTMHERWCMAMMLQTLYALMLMNTKNVGTTIVTPSKKENAMVPKPLLPYYSYHVLNVDRAMREAVTLEDVDKVHRSINQTERRMHLVRGHFKNLRGNLHWWSPHMRNKHSEKVISKDYQLTQSEKE